MSSEQILKGKQFLDSYDWTNVTAESLTQIFEEMISKICDKKGPKNVNSDGKIFKSKNRIPRQTRLWLRRKSLASKQLRKATSINSCRRLKDKIGQR